MQIINIQEIKELAPTDLANKIIETKQALFKLKFQQTTRKTIKTHLFKRYKRMLAQLLTIEYQSKNLT